MEITTIITETIITTIIMEIITKITIITETKITKRKDDSGNMIATVEEFKKWCRPSTAMQIFLMCNLSHQKGYKGTIYENDPARNKLRREEIELKKELNNEDWG